jgi:pyridoxamine 5'-phosphate oxidase
MTLDDKQLADLRRRYTKSGLVESDLPDEPMALFSAWFEQALETGVPEPNAMTLATISPEGLPDARIVLLKGVEDESVVFYTNYESQKGLDLAANPVATCVFWWAELERQVRISGEVQKVSEEESTEYFLSRPRESRIGAWTSDQSRPVQNRDELQKRFEELQERFDGQEIPKPDYWGGYALQISRIEFWQGRPGRLHDRIEYRKSGSGWTRRRLAP